MTCTERLNHPNRACVTTDAEARAVADEMLNRSASEAVATIRESFTGRSRNWLDKYRPKPEPRTDPDAYMLREA